jgi:exodeoxyribonuclease V beta subunit
VSDRRVVRPAVLRQVPLDRHAVIEASAGTGKTFTLEHLVVELVLSADAKLDEVLVVTFTEKATNELRVRVRAKLEQLLAGGGDEPDAAQLRAGDYWTLDELARGKIARALRAFDGATIATIHAFCQRVLRENAFASGRLFDEQQVDGRDAFARAMREALRRDVARDPQRARPAGPSVGSRSCSGSACRRAASCALRSTPRRSIGPWPPSPSTPRGGRRSWWSCSARPRCRDRRPRPS